MAAEGTQKVITREPWQAAELLEAIIGNANPATVYLRIGDVMWGRLKSEFVGTEISTDENTGIVEVVYRFPELTIMKNVSGASEDVISWLKTGLREGQDVWLTARDPYGYRAFAVKQRFVDRSMARSLNTLVDKGLEQRAKGNAPLPPYPTETE